MYKPLSIHFSRQGECKVDLTQNQNYFHLGRYIESKKLTLESFIPLWIQYSNLCVSKYVYLLHVFFSSMHYCVRQLFAFASSMCLWIFNFQINFQIIIINKFVSSSDPISKHYKICERLEFKVNLEIFDCGFQKLEFKCW